MYLIVRCFDLSPKLIFFKFIFLWKARWSPMKGIFNGVLNCTHCNFSLNRQNYRFLKKEITFSLREKRDTYSTKNRCLSHHNLDWETSNGQSQMYLFFYGTIKVLSLVVYHNYWFLQLVFYSSNYILSKLFKYMPVI